MKRLVRAVLATVLVALALGLGAVAYLLKAHEPAPVNPAWAVEGTSQIPDGAVSVRFTGTSTLIFSDGETTWMTDGWFSRPSPLALAFGRIQPDLEAIERGLDRNGVDALAAVFPLHSHYDHAMDAPEVAKRTGAVLLGSESTANIGRGWGLPETQIEVVTDREPITLGDFTITPIESKHFEFPDPKMAARALGDPIIEGPLTPPAGAFDYRVGKTYILYVEHPRGRWIIQGSAGFVDEALEGYDADLVFLGVGGLGSQTDDYRERYWRESVGRTKPSRVIPIHWDSLTGPIAGPFTGPSKAASLIAGSSETVRDFLESEAQSNPEIEILTLPRYDPVVLF